LIPATSAASIQRDLLRVAAFFACRRDLGDGISSVDLPCYIFEGLQLF